MILIIIGEHQAGKTHFLTQLSNIFFDFHGNDDLTWERLPDCEHKIVQDAARNELSVVALDADSFIKNREKFLAKFNEWSVVVKVQILQAVPFIPTSGGMY